MALKANGRGADLLVWVGLKNGHAKIGGLLVTGVLTHSSNNRMQICPKSM